MLKFIKFSLPRSPVNQFFTIFNNHRYCHPNKDLFVFLDEKGLRHSSFTYQSFWDRVHTIALYLSRQTYLMPGDRVLVVFEPGIELIAALLACHRSSLVAVPTNCPAPYSLTPSLRRMEAITRDCQPAILLTNELTRKSIDSTRYNAKVNSADIPLTVLELPFITTDSITTDSSASTSFDDLSISSSDVFIIQYTSGSTGKPKGVILSVDGVLANSKIVVDHSQPVAVSWLPQHHDMGLFGYYIYIALNGGTTYGFSTTSFIQRPALWLETLTRYRATATSVPNFALDMCINPTRIPEASLHKFDLSNLRFLMAAAEPIKPQTFNNFYKRFSSCGLNKDSFFVAYGLAEFTLAVTNYGRTTHDFNRLQLVNGKVEPLFSDSIRTAESDSFHPEPKPSVNTISLMSCGYPLLDSCIKIVDPDTLIACQPDQTGEIWVSGGSRGLGYWNQPQESKYIFYAQIRDDKLQTEYLRTGDIGFIYDDQLFVCGRKKELIIIRGENYFPHDIEDLAIKAIQSYRPRAAVAFEISETGVAKVCVVVEINKLNGIPDGQSIIAAVNSGLGLTVDIVVFVESKSLPKTTSGKLMRLEVKKLWCNQELHSIYVHRIGVSPNVFTGTPDNPQTFASYLLSLKSQYSITGQESYSIIDSGIDSIEIVTLLGWIKRELEFRGATHLSEQVDIRLLHSVSIKKLFELSKLIQSPSTHWNILSDKVARTIQETREKWLAKDYKKMAVDAKLPISIIKDTAVVDPASGHILLTGGTGFLGPFLIASLLKQTSSHQRIKVLVRGNSQEHCSIRLLEAFSNIFSNNAELLTIFSQRVDPIYSDLSKPSFGLSDETWRELANSVSSIFHNGAAVNYLLSYDSLYPTNVYGTQEVIRLAFDCRKKELNYISTTFVFGWNTEDLLEANSNKEMSNLDFGYSQSKWVAEQLVLDAGKNSLPIRVFRPSLITPSTEGKGSGMDITLRLLAFMIKHGVTVDTPNQISFTPADITANNIVGIALLPTSINAAYHVVRDNYSTMNDVASCISSQVGISFKPFSLEDFVPEVVRRCTPEDPLYPLIDFLVGSMANISTMKYKRYISTEYKKYRSDCQIGIPDPSLSDTVSFILDYLKLQNIIK